MKKTKLAVFIESNYPDITASELMRRSGASMDHVRRVKSGRANPTLAFALRLRTAAAEILGRAVDLSEMFDIGDDPRISRQKR